MKSICAHLCTRQVSQHFDAQLEGPICEGNALKKGGQGRDRTVDLPIFSRTLVPTELPGQQVRISPN